VPEKGGRQPAPGFEITLVLVCPGMRFLEGSDAASYERRQLQIEGKAFWKHLKVLRGGGAITNVEGAKATAAISRKQSAK
jgi:hypothetical protein